MGQKRAIEHEAIVVSRNSEGSLIDVVIADNATEACSGCVASSFCKGKKQKLTISVDKDKDYTPGQRVTIVANSSMHTYSVTLLLILPFLCFCIPLLALIAAGLAEWLAMLVSIFCCVLTYLILWVKRKQIESRHNFKVL